MNVIPSGAAPGGNIASTGMAIWIAVSGGTQFAIGVFTGAIPRPRWIVLAGFGAVSRMMTGEASATGGRTGICLTDAGWSTRNSTAATAVALARTGTQCDLRRVVSTITASQCAANARLTCS